MQKATEIIKRVAQTTDEAILFHSASGKDSIALLHLMAPHFKKIVCVFMYIVKDLMHISRYIEYAKNKYPNIEFVQIPHYALFSYIKYGTLGMQRNEKQRLYTLADLTDRIRKEYNIQWAFFGFKQSDSMNRRLMLRTYDDDAINYKTQKAYPLSPYKNKDIIHYINSNNLIPPESYGKGQSSGTAIGDEDYLVFLRNKFPKDLEKITSIFPDVKRLLFEYDYKQNNK